MSRMDIGEIQTFAHQLHTANETARKSIKDIKTAVENYTEDGSLKGKAIDASKNYYQMTYFPLCDAIIEAMNESEERLAQYIADFHAQVDGSADAKIDADGLYELGKMIDRIEAKKEALVKQMNTGTEGQMQSYRSQLSIAYKQENILEKYLAFEQSHGSFFDNLTDLVQGIQQTIRELQSNIQFNSKTGTYDMSKLNFTTVTRMQNALGKALKNNETTFNFDEYQKTYRGQMWVLMKNGIVDVEATNAYNAAVLNGELPHESNEAQEEAELLQAVIQSVKEGIDPVTGQEISKAQGFGIISGFIFYYTAGGYKGKKIKIPKNILDKIKAANKIKYIESLLTPAQKKSIKRIDNNIQDHLTDGDFSGTKRDLEGNPVPKKGQPGKYWNHLDEMLNTYQSLNNSTRSIENSLTNPNLDKKVRVYLESKLKEANLQINKIEDLFDDYGGIQNWIKK
ncbi:TPA: T7SS effector LXG polymorphic toxin [Listeria monocytogenes]|uniref:T7SS effector LXG polymorphic toxin n=1 Tax=Listeria monocytogenes TaxID=1639 RepID=UPI000AA4F5AD|nr:T7SS effector LXG polymorphic toxin [Listeria monocytogenes]EAF0351460.1 transposase [Listeria monocytogenes]EGJ5775161.1 transposase [Listeria monocytogenes]EKZ1157742.1 transposase [Listeria monocytogenes]EKZ1160611.1 transposase [Listeria monocytogenes]EKZ1166282.1 transposase [Listeria monocytogenes]